MGGLDTDGKFHIFQNFFNRAIKSLKPHEEHILDFPGALFTLVPRPGGPGPGTRQPHLAQCYSRRIRDRECIDPVLRGWGPGCISMRNHNK